MKIFVDSDVILDVLLERTGFEFSKELLSHIEEKRFIAVTSPIVFTNSFYIISKLKNEKKAWISLQKLRLIFSLTKISQKNIDKALASEFDDFEDAVQYYAALEEKVDFLVTRNKKDYNTASELPIMSPEEFLGQLT